MATHIPTASTTWSSTVPPEAFGVDRQGARTLPPLTVQPIANGYVVYPPDTFQRQHGSTFESILSEMAFFPDLQGAQAYLTAKWSGMLDQPEEEQPAKAQLTSSRV